MIIHDKKKIKEFLDSILTTNPTLRHMNFSHEFSFAEHLDELLKSVNSMQILYQKVEFYFDTLDFIKWVRHYYPTTQSFDLQFNDYSWKAASDTFEEVLKMQLPRRAKPEEMPDDVIQSTMDALNVPPTSPQKPAELRPVERELLSQLAPIVDLVKQMFTEKLNTQENKDILLEYEQHTTRITTLTQLLHTLSLEIKQPLVENLRNETLKQLLLLVNPGSDSPNYKVYEVPDADTKQDPK